MKKILLSATLIFPVFVFAQTANNITTLKDATGTGGGLVNFLFQVNTLINYIVPFIIGLAVLVIIYGVFGYVSSAGDEEKRKTAKDFIIWGIIGVFIMLSVWGLINILVNTFNLNTQAAPVPAVTLP